MTPILPGATIGLLGGGQLGRMTALAARAMGYDIVVLDPDPHPPAGPLASQCITARFDDVVAATRLAEMADVVTLEIERIAPAGLVAASEFAPVRPGAKVLEIVGDRARQKEWLVSQGAPVGAYATVSSVAECRQAVERFGVSYVKAATGGYDGRGQVRVTTPDECAEAWTALRATRCVVEQAVDLAAEISVMVARRSHGETAVYPPALNVHEAGQLAWSAIPARLDPGMAERATELALWLAEGIGVVGLLAVEMFIAADGRLLVNELAPRPHNSFHHTIEACITNQFEQLVRAVCDLPLGDTAIVTPAAIANILGDAWHGSAPPDFAAALAVPGTRLHLYGKKEARPARKMGHLAAVGDTTEEAIRRVMDALGRLGVGDPTAGGRAV
ncbi:MAG TPA: 5-(carboxyamino)imidazole ribonucleotide synthase [Gemmatimonadaceae bacterium]|nr:5-(carboxyamino)imidazole ribonucleotide synthase [Gemmatimonadaceae bacterium]